MARYIHKIKDWPQFTWRADALTSALADVRHRQGRLLGRMEALGFPLRSEAALQTLTQDVLKSSEIEGEILDHAQVRSSIARRLGVDIGALAPADRHVDGVVEMMLDATQNYRNPLTKQRLFGWPAALFPTGYSGLSKIKTGAWRDEKAGPMQVISGPLGRERVHFEAPDAARIAEEMKIFLAWFAKPNDLDPVLRAGIAHLWFVTIHPFEDGNGRIARAITDLALSVSEESAQRFYSMSAQIRQERKAYYDMLEQTQKGGLDITEWLLWFLSCLGRAINSAEEMLAGILHKARFWEAQRMTAFNERQRLILNKLLDGFEGNLTTAKWAKITKCSTDTALRDITALIDAGLLEKGVAGSRSTFYVMVK